MKLRYKSLLTIIFLSHWTLIFAQEQSAGFELVHAQDLRWGYLNPLRGDKSPAATELWGNRTKDQTTGMLVKFKQGFSSPPHIHNISYRGVVIDGLIHNDDPGAEKLWMPGSSFWTQPAGANHITAANGENNLIYLEIDSGPYLVKPESEAFDNGEVPLNLHTKNLVWQPVRGEHESLNHEMAFLWGAPTNGNSYGTLIKLSSGFNGQLISDAREFRMIVISGRIQYKNKELPESNLLSSGSYVGSFGDFAHHIRTMNEVILYVRADAEFKIVKYP